MKRYRHIFTLPILLVMVVLFTLESRAQTVAIDPAATETLQRGIPG